MSKPATWSNISNASSPSVEVKVPPQAPIDLKPLCAVLEEGFKRWHMAHANEMVDGLESVDKSILELSNQAGSVGVGVMDLQKDLIEVLGSVNSKLAFANIGLEQIAKNLDMIEDNLPLINHSIKNLKLDANIPITNLTVALPRFVVLYALFAPIIFALISLLIFRLH